MPGLGGYGSIFHMITTLKNNRKLLRKSNLFKRKKGYFEYDSGNELIGGKFKIEKKPLSPEKRNAIRVRIQEENKRSAIFYITVALIATTITLLLTIGISKKIIKSNRDHKIEQRRILEEQRKAELNEKREKYNFYIQDGDSWLNHKNYNNAIFQYKLAVATHINDKEAQKRLILAYSLQCINKNIGCEYSIYQLKKLIDSYPDDKELYELIIDCKEFYNDTSELDQYYNAIDRLTNVE